VLKLMDMPQPAPIPDPIRLGFICNDLDRCGLLSGGNFGGNFRRDFMRSDEDGHSFSGDHDALPRKVQLCDSPLANPAADVVTVQAEFLRGILQRQGL